MAKGDGQYLWRRSGITTQGSLYFTLSFTLPLPKPLWLTMVQPAASLPHSQESQGTWSRPLPSITSTPYTALLSLPLAAGLLTALCPHFHFHTPSFVLITWKMTYDCHCLLLILNLFSPRGRVQVLELTLKLEKTESRKRGQERMRWLDGIINPMEISVSELSEMVKYREAWRIAVHGAAKSRTRLSNWTATVLYFSLDMHNHEYIDLAFPFSRGSSQFRDLTQVSRTAGRFFPSWVTGKGQFKRRKTKIIWIYPVI